MMPVDGAIQNAPLPLKAQRGILRHCDVECECTKFGSKPVTLLQIFGSRHLIWLDGVDEGN